MDTHILDSVSGFRTLKMRCVSPSQGDIPLVEWLAPMGPIQAGSLGFDL